LFPGARREARDGVGEMPLDGVEERAEGVEAGLWLGHGFSSSSSSSSSFFGRRVIVVFFFEGR
jgi:hypothetical protein